MDLFDLNIELNKYIEDHSGPVDPVLQELRRITFLKAPNPRMISGPVQGKFLEMISKIKQPENILEIGTFTGYGTICLARGLREKGQIISIDTNDELAEIALNSIIKAGLKDKVRLLHDDALNIIPELPGYFDLIFIDGAKDQYPEYFELVRNKVKSGGLIIVDNVLWEGKVLDHKLTRDTSTKAIHSLNDNVQNDDSFENVLLPIRDGLMIIRKK